MFCTLNLAKKTVLPCISQASSILYTAKDKGLTGVYRLFLTNPEKVTTKNNLMYALSPCQLSKQIATSCFVLSLLSVKPVCFSVQC